MRTTKRLAIFLLSSLALGWGCGADDSGTGNTNWNIECEETSECEDGLICQCGTCSESCDGTLDCNAEPEAHCLMGESLEAGSDDSSRGSDEAGSSSGADDGAPSDGDASTEGNSNAVDSGEDTTAEDGGGRNAEGDDAPEDAGDATTEENADGGALDDSEDGNIASDDDSGPDLPNADDPPDPSLDAELCSLPVAQWQTMAPYPELNSMERAVGWAENTLHYMGDGNSRTDFRTNTLNYGRFDPCANQWESQSFTKTAEAANVIGWDGAGFTLAPSGPSYVLNTANLRVSARAGSRFAISSDTLSPITEAMTAGQVMVYPEEAGPEPLPVTPSYMNGATDGTRGFVWGQPLPSDDDPDPAPRGWVLELSSSEWREVSSVGAPSVRRNHGVIAAGGRFIVWGGTVPNDLNATLNDGAFYAPDTDTWEPITSDGAPQGTIGLTLYWIADRLVVRPTSNGGVFTPGEGWQLLDHPGALPTPLAVTGEDELFLVVGTTILRLDVITASWVDVPTPSGSVDVENEARFFDAAWTGSTLILWGSSIPQSCNAPEGVTGCDVADPYLPAGEGVMVRLD